MAMSKHTPGPWFVPEGPFVTGLTIETRAIDEFIECPGSGGAMSVTTTICTLEWSGTPVWESNARLIAAAPDILEALEEARTQVAILQDRLGIKDTGAGTLSIIDAALAKATPRSGS
jgi:hypothetical protein